MIRKIEDLYRFLKTRSGIEKIVLAAGICFIAFCTFTVALFFLVWTGILGSLPVRDELLHAKNPLSSEVYSVDSVLLGRYFIQERSSISADQLPKHVIAALLATEDIRFLEHHGIDKRSILRVLLKSLVPGGNSSGGASTITQQLAKNLYPRKNYLLFSVFINKMREVIIARRLESVFDKQSILVLYLNTVPFGENTYGLEAASQLFFSLPARSLSIEQAATLIGMLRANQSYNPRLYPMRSRDRRNVVISQMAKYKMISEEHADSLKLLPLELTYNKITHHSGLAPYFREHIRPELIAWCEEYNRTHEEEVNLYTSGLKIYTTIDSRMQKYAEEAMTKQLAPIQESLLKSWGKVEPWNKYPGMIDELIKRSEHYLRLEAQGLSHEDILRELETPVPMTVFNWSGDRETVMSPIDSIKYYLKFLNAGILAMDPENGAVRVWVGGIQHRYFQFDHVRESTKRQVGSTFKPVVYAAALEQGVRPCTFIPAQKIQYTNMKDWAPENYEENYNLLYSMPGALAHSINTVSVQLLEKAGISNTIRLAKRMGIQSQLDPFPSLALGSANISVIEMVGAYSSFVKNGEVVKPNYITSIHSLDGGVLEQFVPVAAEKAMSAETAQMMVEMLRRAVNEGGTSSGLKSRYRLPNDIGGKTGTTQSNTDGWFVAITPKLVIGAWVGADDPRMRPQSTAIGQGARTALPIVGDFFLRVNKDKSLKSISSARFAELNPWLASKLDCAFSREETRFLRKLFAKKGEKEKKREFSDRGDRKKGFFKRLFGKKEETDSLEKR